MEGNKKRTKVAMSSEWRKGRRSFGDGNRVELVLDHVGNSISDNGNRRISASYYDTWMFYRLMLLDFGDGLGLTHAISNISMGNAPDIDILNDGRMLFTMRYTSWTKERVEDMKDNLDYALEYANFVYDHLEELIQPALEDAPDGIPSDEEKVPDNGL